MAVFTMRMPNEYMILYTCAVLEITIDHWSFSDQLQYLADQNPFWSAKFTCTFSMGQQSLTYKIFYLKNWLTNF